ncbi:MAG TPA: cytochrome c peroxidase [Myxococcales bacterium]|nr:cytochrome c peroxidase [Myxococcales bacterium]
MEKPDAGGAGIVAAPDAGAIDAGAMGAMVDAGVQAMEQAKAAIEGVTLPPAPPLPAAPAFLGEVADSGDNPTTPEKAALGYQLFFDKRLSKSGATSCESCHHPDQAWTSGDPVDKKDNGSMNKRNAPTMENLGYHQNGYYWDGRTPTLEKVASAAWTGQLGATPAEVVGRLNGIAVYRAEFQRAFHDDASADNVAKALAVFLRALRTGNAPWDKYEQGDKKAVSSQVVRGQKVFEKANCALCHAPPLYTDSQFHAVGAGAAEDHGRMDATKDKADDGKFKTPTLRDVAKTAPYFHDGSVKDLAAAIDFMLAGGKAGPNHDEKLKKAKLSAKDAAALKAFIESLTGTPTYTSAPELP